MNTNIKWILVFVCMCCVVNQIYAYILPNDIEHRDEFEKLFSTYVKQSRIEKEIDLEYLVNPTGELASRTINYWDIVVGDIELQPVISNTNAECLDVTANFEKIYLFAFKLQEDSNLLHCRNALHNYYSQLPFSTPYNINNKDIVIELFLSQLTREKIVDYLNRSDVQDSENCFNSLLVSHELVGYPILLNMKSNVTGAPKDFTRDFHFTVGFTPEFNNLVKPIRFNVLFKKEPIKVTALYSEPKGCETHTGEYCYINYQDILDYDKPKYRSPESTQVDNVIRDMLDNFDVIDGFGTTATFEGVSTKELIIDILPKRENFCFREGNENYHQVIFNTAKAYKLTLEQTFQLWAIISEISDCNYTPNFSKSLMGFTQMDISKRRYGTLIEIDPKLPLQLAEEEQYQYLALGDFNEINKLLYSFYNEDIYSYYNYGYNGKINNDNTYFGFLMEAITKNKDQYGTTILFTSDYIKEINQLVKNSEDLSNRPYSFEDFISWKKDSINYLYVLGSLMGDSNQDKKNKVYEFGNFSGLIDDANLFAVATTKTESGLYKSVKMTKEARVLINYLTIKRKYLSDIQFLADYNLNSDSFTAPNTDSIMATYNKLEHKYWDKKKQQYLTALAKNDINLILKKDKSFYDYSKILSVVKGKSGYCARYVKDLGQNIYLNGSENYPNTYSDAWTYDTNPIAVDAYTLIWEAKGICDNKTKCKTVPTTANCCNETPSVQDSTYTYLPTSYINYLVDGAILGIYVPNSKYNKPSNEYTHVAMYIGKTIFGEHLMAHSAGKGQEIKKLRAYINVRSSSLKILRVYVPKSTGITSIEQLKKNRQLLPPTYVVNVDMKKIEFDPNTSIDTGIEEDATSDSDTTEGAQENSLE